MRAAAWATTATRPSTPRGSSPATPPPCGWSPHPTTGRHADPGRSGGPPPSKARKSSPLPTPYAASSSRCPCLQVDRPKQGTRLALPPLMEHGSRLPAQRPADAMGGGGTSARSGFILRQFGARRGDKACKRRRMRALFFLLLGVRRQHVTEPFPHVAQLLESAADRVLGQLQAGSVGEQALAEQRHPSSSCPCSPTPRAAGGTHSDSSVCTPSSVQRVGRPPLKLSHKVSLLGVTARRLLRPVVDALAAHAEKFGELRRPIGPRPRRRAGPPQPGGRNRGRRRLQGGLQPTALYRCQS